MIVQRSSNGPLVAERRTPVAPPPPEPAKPLAPRIETKFTVDDAPKTKPTYGTDQAPSRSFQLATPASVSELPAAQQRAAAAYGAVAGFNPMT